MKATIEIPDDLYRQVKARSALGGVIVIVFFHWLTTLPLRRVKFA